MGDSDDSTALRTVRRRASVIRALGATPTRTSDLVDELDLSRSTVERAVEELAALGFLESDSDGHVRTLAGDLAVTELNRYEGRIATLSDVGDLLAALPHDADVPPAVPDGARVVRAEPHSPQLPVRPLCDLLDAAESVRAFAPAVVPRQVDCYRRNVVDGDTTAKLVLTDPVIDRLVSDFRGELTASLRTPRLHVRRAGSATPPFSLVVAERPAGPEMGLLVYADRGVEGFVGNDDPAAVAWARERLNDCWASATPLARLDDA